MYNNNYNNNNRGYNNNYNNNGNYGNNNGNNGQPQTKSTWAVYTKLKDGSGAFIINAFRKTQQGLVRYTVKPYKETWKSEGVPGVVSSKTGKTYHKMICVIDYPMGQSELVPVLYCLQTQKIVLENKGLVITPNGRGQLANGKRVSGAVVKYYK